MKVKKFQAGIIICLLILISATGLSFPNIIQKASATSPLTLKWQIKLPSSYGHFHPCVGDVDGDGILEIVVKFGDYVYVLNGQTGAIKWTSPKDATGGSNILELADLNKDGIPEIIYCGSGLSVYARDGSGNLLWKSSRVSGESWTGTSIIAGDTNHDGYPEIYVVTQDTTEPYTGCITKLDYTGKILATSEICYKPCWGGLALADANFDGKFEVYLGDRAARGGPGGSSTPYPDNPARGLSCYDADTLETLWVRPDLYHSTPAPVLIDVTGDGVLEVIGNNILNNGACVVDAITGKDIYNWKGKKINNHAKGTVWDVDYDGHVELISAWGYSDTPSCTKDFTVLDLVTGNIDYRASEINNYITYPPAVGDVDGDGYVEILAATSGEIGHGEVGQGMFYIYNRNFQILQIINDYPYGDQLWEPYCVDCDSDGYNEVLIGSAGGRIWCYDTPAKRPEPPPNTWSAWYGPYRQGAYASQGRNFIFEDGFEAGSFSAWTGLTITSGAYANVSKLKSYAGSYSAKFQTEPITSGTRRACAYKTFSETTVIYARAYFYIAEGLPLTDNDNRFTPIQFLNRNGNVISNLQIRRVQGEDRFAIYAFGKLITTTAIYPQPNTWYCLELYTKIHATEGAVKAYINGIEQISLTNINTTALGNIATARFGLANSINTQKTITVYCDYASLSTAYIGPAFPRWDINQDGIVDMYDISIVCALYGSTPESANWNPQADVNSDERVDLRDVVLVAVHYGERYT